MVSFWVVFWVDVNSFFYLGIIKGSFFFKRYLVYGIWVFFFNCYMEVFIEFSVVFCNIDCGISI